MSSSAPDITADFIKQLKKNGATSKNKGDGFYTLVGLPAKLMWFKSMVKNSAPWDFKNNIYKGYKTSGVTICGEHYDNDMMGNFHYGYVGAAASIADELLFQGAGHAQRKAGTTNPAFQCTYGDDPVDHDFIGLGIKLYDKHGLSFSQANLKSILQQASPKKCVVLSPATERRIRELNRISGRPKL